jgi:hypothetical protein
MELAAIHEVHDTIHRDFGQQCSREAQLDEGEL